MKSSILLSVSLALVTAFAARAQTTGVPGINDLTITGNAGGGGSGTWSCNALGTIMSGPGILSFDVSCAPNAPLAIFVSWTCSPCWFPIGMGFSPCAIPPRFCWPTNLWFDLPTVITSVSGISPAVGSFVLDVPIPAGLGGLTLAAQAAILDPACSSGMLPVIVSQAHTFTL